VTPARSGDGDAIAFAERLLALLDEGRVATTYKYAVMLALTDVCIERTNAAGSPPSVITTRQLAEKVVELYWPHTVPYRGRKPSGVLRQSGTGRAEILTLIQVFRAGLNADPLAPLGRARNSAPTRFERLVRDVEWKLIEMPLPRLQTLRKHRVRFIYDIGWDESIRSGVVRRYQRGERDAFDNRILLLPGVGEHFVRLNGVIRPLLHRHWASLVAQFNGLEESKLERFLFGTERTALTALRGPLADLQEGRCFYCRDRLRQRTEVDHFIPWSRFPDDALDNLVAAHDRCNAAKRDFLAAAPHVRRWRERLENPDMGDLATATRWHRNPDTTLGVARAIYLRLPPEVPLWEQGATLRPSDPASLAEALGAA
jgi:hypothetical protein